VSESRSLTQHVMAVSSREPTSKGRGNRGDRRRGDRIMKKMEGGMAPF